MDPTNILYNGILNGQHATTLENKTKKFLEQYSIKVENGDAPNLMVSSYKNISTILIQGDTTRPLVVKGTEDSKGYFKNSDESEVCIVLDNTNYIVRYVRNEKK